MRASRTFTFTNVNQLADDDAIKTTIATSESPVIYDDEALNGEAASEGVARPAPNGHSGLASYPTVTTSAEAGAYVPGSKVVFYGRRDLKLSAALLAQMGGLDAVTATITAENGNETAVADGPLLEVLRIEVEAQASEDGALTFGFTDLAPRGGQRFIQLDGLAEGNIHVAYADDEDTIPTNVGRKHECMPSRIFADSTAIFTLYRE